MKLIKAEEFSRLYITDSIFLVCFSMNGCPPCVALDVVLPTIDNIDVYKILSDTERNRELAKEFGVVGYPTMLIFKDKKVLDRKGGYKNKQQIEEWVNKYLNQN